MMRHKKDQGFLRRPLNWFSILVFFAVTACATETMTDKAHALAVKTRAVLLDKVPAGQVTVHAYKDLLQVAGFVDNVGQLKNVLKLVEREKKDYVVLNAVYVVSPGHAKADDLDLEQRVASFLTELKYPVKDLSIQARNGHVILGGFINEHIDSASMGLLASAVPGVVQVNNCLNYKT